MTKRSTKARRSNPSTSRTDWKRLDATTEKEIAAQAREDDTDFPEAWWQKALVVPPPKAAVSLRVDADVLAWFRQTGRGYQTRMNAVLRRFVDVQSRSR